MSFFERAVETATRLAASRIRTVTPATVVAYDPLTGTATVQPGPMQVAASQEAAPAAPIPLRPVAFPAGGGFFVTWPLLPGDPVSLLTCDRDIGGFRTTGAPYKPASRRMHNWSDSIVWPGFGPAPDPAVGASPTDLVIIGPTGPVLRITPAGTVHLGETSPVDLGLPVARVSDAVAPSVPMGAWMGQVAAALNAIAAGSVSPAVPTEFGAIAAGSGRVTAG